MLKLQGRRFSERTRMLVLLLAVMLPAAALIIWSLIHLRELQRRKEIEAFANGSASTVRRSGPDDAEAHLSIGGDQSVIDTPFGDNACDLGQIDNQVGRSSI